MIPNPRTRALDSVLSRDEFFAMLAAAKDAKDRAILSLGVVGLRANEIAQADSSWVDLSRKHISIPSKTAKGGKARVVPYGGINVVSDIITNFFACSPKGVDLSRVAVWGRVKRMASKAKITHPVTAHGLRATGATWLAASGYSITGLLAHFGWASIQTAHHYVVSSGAAAQRDLEEHGRKIL